MACGFGEVACALRWRPERTRTAPHLLLEGGELGVELDGEVAQALVVALLDVVRVEVFELVVVEARRRLGAAFEGEPLYGLLRGEDFVVAVRPRQALQVVAHCLGQVTQRLVLLHARGAVALLQLLAVGPVDERDVPEVGRRPAAGLVDLELARRVGDVIRASDHVRYRHVVVVHDHC